MNKIIVKHIPQSRSPYGREQRPVRTFNPQTKQMEDVGSTSGKRKPNGVHETLRFNPDRQQGKFITGLEDNISNPLYKLESVEVRGTYGLSDKWTDDMLEKIVASERISKQQYYEILDGVVPGYYTPTMAHSLKNSPIPIRTDMKATDQTFIEKFEIILYEGSNIFTTDTSRGRLAVQLLTNSTLVAPSQRDINKDIHHWYIAEEHEEEKTRVQIDDLENTAIVALTELLTKQPTQRAYQVGVSMGIFSGHLNEYAIKDQLNRYIKAKLPQHQREEKIKRLRRFMDLYDMITTNFPLFISTYMTNQAMKVGVLYMEGGKVYWKSKQATPEFHAWRSKNSLTLALVDVMGQYDPDREINDNLFGDMVSDLRDKNIIIDLG